MLEGGTGSEGWQVTGEEKEAGHWLCWMCAEATKGSQGESPG